MDATNWTSTCSSIATSSGNGWYTNVDDLVLVQATPTATPTVVPSARTIAFDSLPNPRRVLNGQYPSGIINWGTNTWWLAGPYAQFSTPSISCNGAGPTSASFTLVSAARLVQVDADNGGAVSSQVSTIVTGWTAPCTSVSVASTNGWDTNFDRFVLQ